MKTPLLSHQKNVFIARDGKVIGEYPVLQLPSLLETSYIFPTDFCYDGSLSEWIPVSQFVEKTKFYKPHQETALPPPPGGKPALTIEGEKRKRRFGAATAGWIAFTLALAGLGAALVWAWMGNEVLEKKNEEVASLNDQLRASKEQYDRLSFSYREIADPGVIRGSLINRNEEGTRSAMPGMKVQLYSRDVIEAYLDKRYKELPKGTVALAPDDMLKYFLTGMPDPLSTTVTDASGRYQFKVPKPGGYVIYTSVTSGQGSRVWFLSVDSADPLNTPVDVTDSNYVRDFIPDLMIAEGR